MNSFPVVGITQGEAQMGHQGPRGNQRSQGVVSITSAAPASGGGLSENLPEGSPPHQPR